MKLVRSRPLANTTGVQITGTNGEPDTLTVDNSAAGLITVRDGIVFDGGTGAGNTLNVIDAPQATSLAIMAGLVTSVTGGLTYNFVNPTTGYQSGVDFHLDVGTSYSLSESLYVGGVGYLYNQISPDNGVTLARLGGFQSRVAGAGPQIGWGFTVGAVAIDLNLRAYAEFAARNRPEGVNAFLSVSFSAAKRRSCRFWSATKR